MNREKYKFISFHLVPKPECLPTEAPTDTLLSREKIQVETGNKQIQFKFYKQHKSDRKHVNSFDSVCRPYYWKTFCKFLNEKLRRDFRKEFQ